MQFKVGMYLSFLSIILFSCDGKNQFHEKHSVRVPIEKITLYQSVFQYRSNVADSLFQQKIGNGLLQLKSFIQKYESHSEDFSVEKMELLWESEKSKIDYNGLETVQAWIEANGFLLEITGKPVYAEALQKISSAENMGLTASEFEIAEQELAPFIFTKNVDHIFVNLFVNSSVEYVHSLDGKVKITQKSKGSDGFLLKFNMEQKRYIEVNILIPTWAVNATVVEKNVKYVATPGEYCLIARKWEDGDMVEIKY